MPETQNSKRYDLGERTLRFSQRIVVYVNELPRTLSNIEISKQLIRAADSLVLITSRQKKH